VNLLVRPDEAELGSFARSVGSFCAGRRDIVMASRQEQEFPQGLWHGLARLGVLGLGTADGGGATWMAAAMVELGRALCPGPLPSTLMSIHLLSADVLVAVVGGDTVVSVGVDGLFPWGLAASLLIGMDGDEAWAVDAAAPRQAMATLGREPWARSDARRVNRLDTSPMAAAVGDLAVAAYLLGAASTLVDMGAEHARTRQQFGRPIGGFEAVAFSLASSFTALYSAGALVRAAAEAVDSGVCYRAPCAAARLVAADVALRAARVVHQVHGGGGFVEESPVGAYAARIRQWSLLAPSQASRRRAVLASAGALNADVQSSKVQHASLVSDTAT
jgi:alkylation response protein AidB-like acyl-CoA dehydrogenase